MKRRIRTSSKNGDRPPPPTCPSASNQSVPIENERQRQAIASLVAPHINSFNYVLDTEIHQAVKQIIPIEVELSSTIQPKLKRGGRKRGRKKQEAEAEAEAESLPDESIEKPMLKLWFESVKILQPLRSDSQMRESRLFPADCRESSLNYSAPFIATMKYMVTHQADSEITSSERGTFKLNLGNLPIMVGSTHCHLHGLTPKELVARKEDALEQGGYFLCNGIERVVRLLQMPKANYMHAVKRPSYKKRGPEFTDKAVTIRCVTSQCTTITNTLHYLRDGTILFKFVLRKSEFFVPVALILKALKKPMSSDREIYHAIIGNDASDVDLSSRIELNLAQVSALKLFTAKDCRAHLGKQFRTMLAESSATWSDEEVGAQLLNRYILIHCEGDRTGTTKFKFLVEMIRKLCWFVMNKCVDDNPDAFSNHDLLLPGQIYGALLRERLEQVLLTTKAYIGKDVRVMSQNGSLSSTNVLKIFTKKYLKSVMEKQGDVGAKLFYFLSTGNLVSESGLDMMQVAGYTIIAEKLNRWRYLSHFRSVHRGQFFTEMRTTGVRKLLPESWGFLCPVHTPDGAPCGLLSHLAAQATVVCDHFYSPSRQSNKVKKEELITMLCSFGMTSSRPKLCYALSKHRSKEIAATAPLRPILLDGVVLGYATVEVLKTAIVPALRALKVRAVNRGVPHGDPEPYIDPVELTKPSSDFPGGSNALPIPGSLEICFVDETVYGGNRRTNYPGLYLFAGTGRVIRPVLNLKSEQIELIGPSGQVFMNIAVAKDEVEAFHSHREIFQGGFLSLVASLTPFSDFNQSPRNMYQCQMAKQTMGTPAHNLKYRHDNKLYQLNTPQVPLCLTSNQQNFLMDEFANGTNAVVAVISYTGYDMEDACIINKAAINRGFKHGTIYKTVKIDLGDKATKFIGNVSVQSIKNYVKYLKSRPTEGNHQEEPVDDIRSKVKAIKSLDFDGLPFVGQRIGYMEPYCAIYDVSTGAVSAERHKSTEIAVVESVKVVYHSYSSQVSLVAKVKTDLATYNAYSSFELTNHSVLKLLNPIKHVVIKLRYNRVPMVGDKFASRAGQKGVMSVAWPQEDMPFTDTGITPDLIINPHAFPSRMTIGMLLESMAGKAGALHCKFQDASPFKLQGDEHSNTAVDRFGKELLSAGFSYYGAESMYSGLLGTPLQVDIYIGLVYYQRLRHMVSDKSQVRSLGPIDPVTRQPVKGRKRQGGVRFGEMERDSLLAHGTAFLAQDRLLNCSDRHVAYICCGSLLSVCRDKKNSRSKTVMTCKLCGKSNSWKAVAVPFVLRYLVNELAAMGIQWKFKV